jgi:hypothetical protein
MEYRVTILKRLTFTVQAASADEARALAVVTATGAARRTTPAPVRCEGRAITVEACEAGARGGVREGT